MFTYIDPSVRQQLIDQGKLVRINKMGELISPEVAPPDTELGINVLGPVPMPIRLPGVEMQVDWYASVRHTELAKVEGLAAELREQGGQQFFAMLASSMAVNSVLVVGDPERWTKPLVRVHSNCMTGDVFGSQRCECGPQLAAALRSIGEDDEGGLVVYMAGHEGRGIGLWAKAATYLLQDSGQDTYQANRSLGLPDDSRDFSDAGALLHYFLHGLPFRLMTNNPKKVDDLTRFGLTGIERVKHVVGVSEWNKRYLSAKKEWGHGLSEDDLT